MRLLSFYIISLILVMGATRELRAEETHSEGEVVKCANGSTVPKGSSCGPSAPAAQPSKFFDYLSACMAGRPGFEGDAGATASISGGGGSSSSADQAVFQSKCLGCHSGPGAPDLTSISGAKAGEGIRRMGLPGSDPKHMPKGKVLTSDEQSAITRFLQSKM